MQLRRCEPGRTMGESCRREFDRGAAECDSAIVWLPFAWFRHQREDEKQEEFLRKVSRSASREQRQTAAEIEWQPK